ncbi:hypothetical protein [Anabaena sp. PCC 7108]|uniref:hypothetical protein n=1 Tax=Anabaena sp. PCC 7108 TaxID=163908 RepID=UPI0011819542|nr:hypothetical protein [Anabaena sp. PCC 7108]
MTENFRFNVRVLYSWISLGLVIDVIVAIIALSSGSSFDVQVLIAVPIVVCIFGLVGLGLDSLRGRNDKHPGWYWWLFPIITYLVMGFWLGFTIFGMSLAMAGIRLPKPRSDGKPRFSQIDPQKFREEIQQSKLKDVLEEFKEEIQKLEQLEQQNKLDSEQAKVVRKLRSFDPSEYDKKFRDLFKKDESEEFILLLLMMLGVDVN